ncbi:hypothetical protein AVEN_162070-1 [Araneus ventricosus]|uniref:Uncharacterized protein n=1 Tax=Araneus ventricosus TaxID=182803 RepID=A0A4Y2L3A7_ARAVE|nr:hypothetical protein AVEN_162070-1 [Araneus ventricosus]
MISQLFTVRELVEEKLTDANLSEDEEVIAPSFIRTYFFRQKSSEKTFDELDSIHNDVPNSHRQSTQQRTTVKDFLNQTPTCMNKNRIRYV